MDGQGQPGPVLGIARSVTGRRWVWRDSDSRTALGIAQRLDVPEVVGRLLAARGIGIEAAGDYLEPTLRALMPDPSSLLDMDQAADRIAAAVRSGEHVAVFGDYDVDGACAGALMARFLRDLGCEVTPYVPDRLKEGYGPNATAIGALCDRGASLVVCVDCGITSGLHHVCAAAVAFLAAVATLRALRRAGWFARRAEPDLRWLLDLVALATVCDVMPLTGFNRALVAQGLKVMGQRARPGIAALLELTAVRDAPSAHTLGFLLGPRINASGRIGEPDLGLRLLLSEDPVEARAIAEKLDAVNRRRQEVEGEVLGAAHAMAERQAAEGRAVLLLVGQGWHPGVVGIVAGRMKERFNRPACVAGLSDGLAKGSGRSVPGIDLGAAVIAARQAGLLETGGGHAMAAGFSFAADREAAFHAFLEDRLGHAALLPAAADLVVEGTLNVIAAQAGLAQEVARLAPFGPGNEEPVFALQRARVVKADRVGKDGATVRAIVEGEGGGRLKTICFRAKDGPLAQALLAPDRVPLHLCGHLRAEQWNGETTATLQVVDAAPA